MLGKVFVLFFFGGIATAMFGGLDSWRLFPKNDVPGMINIFHGDHQDAMRLDRGSLADEIKDYDRKQNTDGARDIEMVNQYYNMATDFYEYGWGQSFHFAHTKKDEGHDESIARHEHRLAEELGLKEGMNAIDLGCGVGGPAREIARYSKAHVKGITLNAYQIARANEHTKKQGMEGKVEFVMGDFTKLHEIGIKDGTLDAAYAIEATCHSPTFEEVYGEIARVLKKGGRFATYEWITASDYDKTNETHNNILKEIEYGNGLPPLRGPQDVEKAAAAVGFKVIKSIDLAQDKEGTRPWYHRMDMSWYEYRLTHATCWIMEFLGLAPEGTLSIHSMLLRAADGLVAGGKTNTFTPMHLFVMEKL
eukprot:TRINITY_DN5087_c0_g1_i1.p1 TRINITY_DN5087_c0_g1~~TRINITY_DN5087_c0_g1_i1.p1  ORF type:complete len:382 (+),score=201.76 TRINITY_DN5087_c0_g1_i1:59-1147(+)